MNTTSVARNEPPFSYIVKVGNVSANPAEVRLHADPQELKGLADLWAVESVLQLEALVQIARWKKDGLRIKGRVRARIIQACVVSLEPVETDIDEEIDQIFVPEGSKLARIVTGENSEMVLDPDGPDLPELFIGDTIDAGAIVAEFAALAIDPYPKKPGVEFSGHIEDTAENDKRPSPFAALKDWKKE